MIKTTSALAWFTSLEMPLEGIFQASRSIRGLVLRLAKALHSTNNQHIPCRLDMYKDRQCKLGLALGQSNSA